jgi:hypothetical protein
LDKGLYASDPPNRDSSFYSDDGFRFPLPINDGLVLLQAERDFELPYDIEYMVEEAGGFRTYLQSHSQSKPSKYTTVANSIA